VTVLSELGTSGSGGGFDVAVGAAAVLLPVKPGMVSVCVAWTSADSDSPTEALVAPPLRSHGLGGDGAAILRTCRRSPPRHQGIYRREGRAQAVQRLCSERRLQVAGRRSQVGRRQEAGLGWAWRSAPDGRLRGWPVRQ
jgi:hypothetical protein